jgi:hypothetical protein
MVWGEVVVLNSLFIRGEVYVLESDWIVVQS